MSKTEPASKQDVEEIVGRVVGEIASNTMQLISERFDKVEAHLDVHDATSNRLENKLDATIEQVDEHTMQLQELQAKAT